MATQTVSATGGAWSASATWAPGSVPANGDDVVLGASSGQLTIDVSTNTIRSLVCTGYTGTITHNAAVTLNIGGGSAPVGNIALIFVGAETYTILNATTSAIAIADTSAAINTYNFAGKTIGNLTITNGTTTTTQLTTNGFTTAGTVNIAQGNFDTNGQTCSWGFFNSANSSTRTITLGASSITITGTGGTQAWAMGTVTGLTFNAGTSTVLLNGAAPTINPGGQSFYNFSWTPGAAKTNIMTVANGGTVTHTLTFTGNSVINRPLVASSSVGTQRTFALSTTGTSSTSSNVDFQDVKITGTNSPLTGTSLGDCAGNSGITFDSPTTQTNTGATGSWSDATKWTSRIPLPQDSAVINTGSGTITADMPRLSGMNFTGFTGTFTLSTLVGTINVFGSMTLVSGMTFTGAQTLQFAGRSSYTLTSGGKTFPGGVSIQAPSGSIVCQDNFSAPSLFFNAGIFDANGNNVTLSTGFSSGTGFTRTLNMGTGTWTLSGTGAIWSVTLATGQTLNPSTSTIAITNTSSTNKTFAGLSLTYANISISGGGTGAVIFTGANTFASLPQITGGTKNITWPGSTTTTFTNGGNFGNSTNVITMIASANSATLSFGSQVNADYLNLTNIIAAGTTPAYAGPDSTNGGGNTNWVFTSAPAQGGGILLMGVG